MLIEEALRREIFAMLELRLEPSRVLERALYTLQPHPTLIQRYEKHRKESHDQS